MVWYIQKFKDGAVFRRFHNQQVTETKPGLSFNKIIH